MVECNYFITRIKDTRQLNDIVFETYLSVDITFHLVFSNLRF